MTDARTALQQLREGNLRFVAGIRSSEHLTSRWRRHELTAGQHPFAIILGCSDSRVPAEIVFDQGLGDLFVIRVAGNIVAPSQIGSVEYAAEVFGARLVVVLGHSNCGAVEATLAELERTLENRSPNIHSIVDRIRPSVEPLLDENGHAKDPKQVIAQAVRANIQASVDQLRHGSEILEGLIHKGRIEVIGAEYSLASGVVDFFDDLGECT